MPGWTVVEGKDNRRPRRSASEPEQPAHRGGSKYASATAFESFGAAAQSTKEKKEADRLAREERRREAAAQAAALEVERREAAARRKATLERRRVAANPARWPNVVAHIAANAADVRAAVAAAAAEPVARQSGALALQYLVGTLEAQARHTAPLDAADADDDDEPTALAAPLADALANTDARRVLASAFFPAASDAKRVSLGDVASTVVMVLGAQGRTSLQTRPGAALALQAVAFAHAEAVLANIDGLLAIFCAADANGAWVFHGPEAVANFTSLFAAALLAAVPPAGAVPPSPVSADGVRRGSATVLASLAASNVAAPPALLAFIAAACEARPAGPALSAEAAAAAVATGARRSGSELSARAVLRLSQATRRVQPPRRGCAAVGAGANTKRRGDEDSDGSDASDGSDGSESDGDDGVTTVGRLLLRELCLAPAAAGTGGSLRVPFLGALGALSATASGEAKGVSAASATLLWFCDGCLAADARVYRVWFEAFGSEVRGSARLLEALAVARRPRLVLPADFVATVAQKCRAVQGRAGPDADAAARCLAVLAAAKVAAAAAAPAVGRRAANARDGSGARERSKDGPGAAGVALRLAFIAALVYAGAFLKVPT